MFQLGEPPFGAPDVGQCGAEPWEYSHWEVVLASPSLQPPKAPQNVTPRGLFPFQAVFV